MADAWFNDDLDMVWDKFRTHLDKEKQKDRPHVVILGAGWAALNMLRKLRTDEFKVTIISPKNYFLFTPLLPSTTCGTLQQRSIVEPIRAFCKRSDAAEANFIEAECISIDPATNSIKCVDNSSVQGEVSEFELNYDHLVVAVGAESATFNIPGVRENSVFLKEVKHSIDIRDRILDSLETAHVPGQPQSEIDRLLHFVVVGGGPSGVEYAAELHDFMIQDMIKMYPEAKKRVKITVVEALPHLLTMFDAALINHTEKAFKERAINVLVNSPVAEVKPKHLVIKNKDGSTYDLPYGVLVWVTGNATRPLIRDLIQSIGTDVQKDRRGLLTDGHFRVLGTKNIWALGDCSINGSPATAQAASQEGKYLGRKFNELSNDFYALSKGAITQQEFDSKLEQIPAFKYHHLGSFAYIGENEAIAQIQVEDRHSVQASGVATFFLWRSVYFSRLLSYKNRFLVITDWMKTAVFGRDISRT